MEFIRQKKSALFLLGILLVGLLTLFPYGFYLDQDIEQGILFANIKEYLMHLPGDAPGLVQELTDSNVLGISAMADRDHGIAAYYPAFPIWYINQASPYWGSIFWHVYTFLLIFWGMCSLFYLGKELFKSEGLAAFVVLLFFLTPRMFAESRYNNKDMVLLSLVFTLFYWGKRLIGEQSAKSIFMFALAGALASNVKIVGIWTFGVLGLYILFYFIATGQCTRKLLGKAAGCILLWAFLFFLLTPASWTDTAAFFRYLFFGAVDFDRWHDYVLFDGRMLHRDFTGMPRKYLPVLMLYTIPVGILLLAAWGSISAVVDFVRKKGKCLEDTGYVLAILLAGAVPPAYAVLMATPLYNGWRHFYFVYASMITGAGYGAFRLWEAARAWGKEIYAKAGAALYLFALAAGILANYPQEHSFYNILAGKNVVERYELDYWNMSVKQACESILAHNGGAQAAVGVLNLPTLWGLEGNLKVLPERDRELLVIADEWEEAEYLIVNTTYAYMYANDEYHWVQENWEKVDSFVSYDNVICEVYSRRQTLFDE